MAQRGIRRRGFLALAAAAGAAAGLPLRPWRSLVEVRSRPLAARLAGVLHDTDGARAVGRAYLAAAPAEASVDVLVDRLRATLGADTALPVRDTALRTLLGAQVRRDFVTGDTCRVDGWVLSLTEARLSALTALAAPEPTSGGPG